MAPVIWRQRAVMLVYYLPWFSTKIVKNVSTQEANNLRFQARLKTNSPFYALKVPSLYSKLPMIGIHKKPKTTYVIQLPLDFWALTKVQKRSSNNMPRHLSLIKSLAPLTLIKARIQEKGTCISQRKFSLLSFHLVLCNLKGHSWWHFIVSRKALLKRRALIISKTKTRSWSQKEEKQDGDRKKARNAKKGRNSSEFT